MRTYPFIRFHSFSFPLNIETGFVLSFETVTKSIYFFVKNKEVFNHTSSKTQTSMRVENRTTRASLKRTRTCSRTDIPDRNLSRERKGGLCRKETHSQKYQRFDEQLFFSSTKMSIQKGFILLSQPYLVMTYVLEGSLKYRSFVAQTLELSTFILRFIIPPRELFERW